MRKVDMFVRKAYVKTVCAARTFLFDEEGDVNIVSMVVLIGVAVLLAVVFKKQIGTLITNLLNNITNSSTDVVTKEIQ